MTNAIETTVRVFAVLSYNVSRVTAALEKLNKRAARKGLPLLGLSWGKAYSEVVVVGSEGGRDIKETVVRVPLTITGETPKYAGWTFAASLTHLDGENVVRALEGVEVPTMYRTRGPACDHCKQNRRRNDTYVLRHEAGNHIQVGSTCITDFLGSDIAGNIADRASLLADAYALADGGCEGGGFGGEPTYTLSELLPWVAFHIRKHGWISRTVARERPNAVATADVAYRLMSDMKARQDYTRSTGEPCAPSDEDRVRAEQAEVWAETLTDEVIAKERGDYLYNIRAIARSGLVTFKLAGLGGSIVSAWDRAMGYERVKADRAARPVCNEYMGAIKDKLVFGQAKAAKGQVLASTDAVTLDFVTGYSTGFGYTTVLKFIDSKGHTIVWKASNTELDKKDVGKKYTLIGTVKEHTEYKGTKQTILTRCSVTEIAAAEVAA